MSLRAHHVLQALLSVGGKGYVLDPELLETVAYEHAAGRRIVYDENLQLVGE